jgi:RecB family exonuclease
MSEEKASCPSLAQEVQITKQETEIEGPPDAILTLSPSRIKTYQQCPRKYYYTYVVKLPRKDWAHFKLGTMVHGVLEFFHADYKKDGSGLNLKRLMKEAFKKQREVMKKENVDIEPSMDILLEANKLLIEYLKRMETAGIGSEIISLEEKFNIRLDEKYSIQGIVDRIDMDADGIMHIRDYKTTKNAKYMEPFQLQSYGIYLMNKYPEIDRFRGSYIMLRHGGRPISYDFNIEDVKKIRQSVLDYALRITQEERWITKGSALCDWCDFKDPCLTTW